MKNFLLGLGAGVPAVALPCWLAAEVLGRCFGSHIDHVTCVLMALATLPASGVAGVVVAPRLRAGDNQVPWLWGMAGGCIIAWLTILLPNVARGVFSVGSMVTGPAVFLLICLMGPIPILGPLWAGLLGKLLARSGA